MNIDAHPCFNVNAHHHFGRVHLPVAPRCNIQCRFCNRQFDCVNESRPGVTSAILSPGQAMVYLEEVLRQKPNTRVVGIAGPGDPFANADDTLETMRQVRGRYPEMILCVATNGLNVVPYLDDLAALNVSHVTVTVNAVDPGIGAEIYAWMRIGKRVVRSEEGASVLLDRQLEAIRGLKSRKMIVKVNSIILPGINEDHIGTIALKMREMGVDLMNCMPYYPSPGSSFEHLREPDKKTVKAIQLASGKHIRQMQHCTRCRSDAVGLLGEAPSASLTAMLQNCSRLEVVPAETRAVSNRPYVAVCSLEGVLVNQHLGEAVQLSIYGKTNGRIGFLESRAAPEPGGGVERWEALSAILADCRSILVSGAGNIPKKVLAERGIAVITCEGVIDEAVAAVFSGQSLRHMAVRQQIGSGSGCNGNMSGCG